MVLVFSQLFAVFLQELVNEFSKDFFELTRRLGWLKSVDVILPKVWSLENCQTSRKVVRQRVATEDHVDVLVFSNTNGITRYLGTTSL